MIQIRPWLLIGKVVETRDHELLVGREIDAMLQLAADVPQPGIASLHIDIDDGQPISPTDLASGVEFVLRHHVEGHRVLVACGAGISRSTTYVIASLMELERLDLLEAFRAVRAVHTEALPHPALWKSLCAYYDEDVPFFALLRERRT